MREKPEAVTLGTVTLWTGATSRAVFILMLKAPKEGPLMAENQAVKQIHATEVKDKLNDIKGKILFLEAAAGSRVDLEIQVDGGGNVYAADGLREILHDIEKELTEIADAEIVTAPDRAETAPEVRGTLDKITKEQLHEALDGIQGDLTTCLPELTVLNGFLGEDPEINSNAEVAVRDTVRLTYEAVTNAMNRTAQVL